MTHALVTVIAPLGIDRVAEASAYLDTLGNPAVEALQDALSVLDEKGHGVHFASMHAIVSADKLRGYLLLECSADGTQVQAIAHLAKLETWLRPVFRMANDWPDGGQLADYLTEHAVSIGAGWFDNPGVGFVGTPGFSVGRIQSEALLAKRIGDILAAQEKSEAPLSRLAAVRRAIAGEPALAPMLEAGPGVSPFVQPPFAQFVVSLIFGFITTFLWPFAAAIALWAIVESVSGEHWWSGLLVGVWHGLICSVAVVILALVLAFVRLLRLEATDVPSDAVIDRATNAEMFVRENRGAQNHMISVTQRKPGLVRRFTSRLVFWGVGEYAGSYFPPGFLSEIGTIHFARWVTAPHSPDVIFLSNYGGSWESYLEDFITRAHAGLTGVWSNTIGFPRTENLITLGATDGERFKRFARHSMVPTRFWFSAYPTLTTANIRTNAAIRAGLAGAMTADEATAWLRRFGSAVRPPASLMENEIQSLILGGLGFLEHGTCLVGTMDVGVKDAVAIARRWLAAVLPDVAFADGRRIDQRRDAVLTLGLTAAGLAKLGLPESALATFPFTFLEGPVTESRLRMLGDIDANAPENWRWGRTAPDVVLLVYGRSQDAVNSLATKIRSVHGMSWHQVPLQPVQATEPFGFADGISQPVIRGTHKATRGVDAMHIVAPGEFVLGYPDNRNNFPPGPVLAATDDPDAMLPLSVPTNGFDRTVVEAPRDLGFNGSYLVIRELEMDVAGFHRYCDQQAEQVRGRRQFACPVTADFIGAKLVGRWKDGSPLVRHPYEPQGSAGHAAHQRQHGAHRKMTADAANPTATRSSAVAGNVENDFLFGTEDADGRRCPYGAHIRRANPRDSFDPGSQDQIDITNRHRIVRVGRRFQAAEGQNEGLLFMCLNGDIERQFEFLQQSWVGNSTFSGLADEVDPLLTRGGDRTGFTIPTADGPVRLAGLPQFVTTRGAGYFFLPGRRLLEYLSRPR
jgi:deferrochelatase/peroxidase EfeB